MKNFALELAPHGIRCNAICPGVMAFKERLTAGWATARRPR